MQTNLENPLHQQTLIRSAKMICTKKEASSGSLLPVVSMMQAADARQRDQTRRLARLGGNRPHCRCVFLKRVMDPVRVIIGDVIADQTTQMSVIEDDHVIEKLSATASDPAFGNPILPRACSACARGFHAAECKQLSYLRSKLAVTIKNRVAILTRFPKGLPQLLHNPRASRVFRHIEMEDPASAMLDDEETIQDSERQSRHREEVHGRNDLALIAKESSPKPAGVQGRKQTPEIAGHGTFGDVQSEFQKLPMNSRSAPAWILLCHPPDESSNLGIDYRPASALWSRSKTPEQTKASPMPGGNGFRFDDDQDIAPCGPKTAEQNPEYSVFHSKPRARMFSLEYAQLLTEGKDLQAEAVTGTEKGIEEGEEAD
jgi:hypothetical protein